MNVVCRLMCREELETFMRGEKVTKGDKGDKIYEDLVGNSLSFSPIKFCDMVTLGDLSAIFANMKAFFIDHSAKSARERNSKLYMVVFEEVERYCFSPHMGGQYITIYSEDSKELLTDEYSMQELKPLRLYEIDWPQDKENDFSEGIRFITERAPVEGYSVKVGFPVQVDSYEEAVNDMLHVLFTEEQIRKIYDGFDVLKHLDYLREEISRDDDDDVWEVYMSFYQELYGREYGKDVWRDIDAFEDSEYEYHQNLGKTAEQVMKGTVDRETAISGDNQAVRHELSNLAKQVQIGKDNLIDPDRKQEK